MRHVKKNFVLRVAVLNYCRRYPIFVRRNESSSHRYAPITFETASSCRRIHVLKEGKAMLYWGLILLFGGLTVGTVECVAASSINSDAEDTNDEARRLVQEADNRIGGKKRALRSAITNVEEAKNCLLQGPLADFITQYGRIGTIAINPSTGLLELHEFNVTNANQQGLHETDVNPAVTGAGSLAGGAAASVAGYQAALTFGTASTGTAIGTLSGAVAKNAALAFLGGGSKAAGGLGMAGGAAALGGIAAGAGLVVLGGVKLFEAGSRRETARANLASARAYQAEMETIMTCADCAIEKLRFLVRILNSIGDRLKWQTACMERIIDRKEESGWNFTRDEEDQIHLGAELARAAKSLLDLQIVIREDGSIDSKTNSNIERFAALAGVSPDLL